MASVQCATTIDVQELAGSERSSWQRIDVRSPTEFAAGHVPQAVNIPMDEIESRLSDLRPGGAVVLICQAGTRAAMTLELLAGKADGLHVLNGGTDAWSAAGLPLVASTRSRWALERQVRLGAGLLILTGVLLGFFVNPSWFYLAGFVGCGLTIAGTTGFCAMASLLALLPWNRRGSSIKGSSGEPRACT